jgi:hypothetical protein
VLGGMVLFPMDQAREVLRFYRDFCPTLPDEAEAYAALLTAPQGMPVIALLLGYNGPIADGEKCFAPARRFRQPLADLVGPMPYTARQTLLDEPNATHGLQRYWRSALTERISDELIGVLVAGAAQFHRPARPCNRPNFLPLRGLQLSAEAPVIKAYAYFNRPLGSGIGRPSSFAVSIHSSMIPCTFARASACVAPSAAQPGSSGTSAMNALSSSLQ